MTADIFVASEVIMWLVWQGASLRLTQCKSLVLSPCSLPSVANFVDYFFGNIFIFSFWCWVDSPFPHWLCLMCACLTLDKAGTSGCRRGHGRQSSLDSQIIVLVEHEHDSHCQWRNRSCAARNTCRKREARYLYCWHQAPPYVLTMGWVGLSVWVGSAWWRAGCWPWIRGPVGCWRACWMPMGPMGGMDAGWGAVAEQTWVRAQGEWFQGLWWPCPAINWIRAGVCLQSELAAGISVWTYVQWTYVWAQPITGQSHTPHRVQILNSCSE